MILIVRGSGVSVSCSSGLGLVESDHVVLILASDWSSNLTSSGNGKLMSVMAIVFNYLCLSEHLREEAVINITF